MRKNKLAEENVKRLLFLLALPSIVGQLVSLVYSIVDRIYIGHIEEIGGDALTGVGVATPLLISISAFAILIGMGASPKASIKLGEGREDEAEEILGNSFVLLLILSFFLSIFFYIYNERLLLAFGASSVTLEYGLDYMSIYSLGIPFVLISLGLNPFISGQGFSKESMFTLVLGAVLNLILDPIFIYGLDLGVKGAALATLISQGVSALWVVYFLSYGKSNLKIKRKYFKLKKDLVISILALGMSPFVMQFTESFIAIAFNKSLQSYGGDVAVGAMTILTTAMQFTFLPLAGIAYGAQPIISYNYGARKKERVRDAFKYLIIASIAYSSLFWLFLMVFPRSFVSIFTDNREIIELGVKGLRIYMAAGFLLGAQEACQQTFIALGNARTSLFLAVLRKLLLLLPSILILPRLLENQLLAVFLAEPISDLIAVSTTVILFTSYFKRVLRDLSLD